MKEQNDKLTLQEIERLCRMYMDCRLTVLEETELQYVLGKVPYSSPCIDEVRTLMGVTLHSQAAKTPKKSFRFFNSRILIGSVASLAILATICISLFLTPSVSHESELSSSGSHVYVEAYSHGKRLSGDALLASTNFAIARADSLMKYASLAERDFLMKANDIISLTTNN